MSGLLGWKLGHFCLAHYKFWYFRSQTTFTRFCFFGPPTPLGLHFLWYKSLQKVNFFDHPPPSSCKRSLWTTPKRCTTSIFLAKWCSIDLCYWKLWPWSFSQCSAQWGQILYESATSGTSRKILRWKQGYPVNVTVFLCNRVNPVRIAG